MLKKVPRFLLACFYLFAALTFAYAVPMAFFWNRERPLPLLAATLLFTLAALIVWQLLKKAEEKKPSLFQQKKQRRLIVALLLAVFAGTQLYFGFSLMLDSTKEIWDIWILRTAAEYIAENPFPDVVPNIAYVQRYENNQFILAFLSLWFTLCHRLFGNVDYEVCGVLLNVISCTLSMGLVYLSVHRLMGVRCAYFSSLLWLLFLPFYGYSSFYYTDLLSLPFITLAFYLMVVFWQEKRPLFAVLAGLVAGLGGKMKGTLLIFLVAAVIWLFFMDGLKIWKRLVCLVLFLAAVFGAMQSFTLFYDKSGMFGKDPIDHEGMATPITHWLMMAQNPNGPYNQDDRDFTVSLPGGYAQRSKACWDVFYGRLVTRGLLTDLIFTNRKMVAVWGDGSYQIDQFPRPHAYHPDSVWFERFDPRNEASRPWFTYAGGMHFFMLICLLITLWHRLIRRNFAADGIFAMQLALLGIFLFELFWEWWARYLISFSPFLIMLAPAALTLCSPLLDKAAACLKHKWYRK